MGFLKGDKTCIRDRKVHGCLTDYIPGQYLDTTPGKRRTDPTHSIDFQMSEALGLVINQKNPSTENGILGISGGCTILHLVFPVENLRNIQQLALYLLYQQTVSVRDLVRFFSISESDMASSFITGHYI